MSKKTAVHFHFLLSCTLSNRRRLKTFIETVFRKEKTALENLNIVFCDDKYLIKLNRKFLQHDFYTDILSFPLSEVNHPLVGEIYISITRIRENARAQGSTIRKELHRVIFHGVLHFCGYHDKSEREKKIIRSKEDKYLDSYFK